MDSVANKTFTDPKDKRLSDRADVNGDEKVDSTDKQTLDDYLHNRINYLPGQWNKLPTRAEREDWFWNIVEIGKVDALLKQNKDKFSNPDLNSADFAIFAYLNFRGHNGIISPRYNIEGILDNGGLNLPLYFVRITKQPSWIHNTNVILVGDSLNGNPQILENLLFFEPQTNLELNIKEFKDSNVEISYINYFFPKGGENYHKLLEFYINNEGNAFCTFYDQNLQLIRDTGTPVADNRHENVVPVNFKLEQNYPNPFNPTMTIEYELPKNEKVKLEVYNILGQKLETLVDGNQASGIHEINWNASKYASGVYLYRIQTKDFVGTKKMMFVK